MKALALLLFFALTTIACSKKKDIIKNNTVEPDDTTVVVPEKAKDFLFIPVNNVKWKIHCSSSYIGYERDTSLHYYTIVTSNNESVFRNNRLYYTYHVTTEMIKSTDTSYYKKSEKTLYLYEDTAAHLVTIEEGWSGRVNTILEFSKYQIGDTVLYTPYYYEAVITSIDSVLINNN